MRLISLNAWGGIVKDALHDFLKEQSATTDVFCIQEVFDNADNPRIAALGKGKIDFNLYTTFETLLPDHTGFYAPSQDNDEGLALFIKPHIKLDDIGSIFVHRHLNALEGNNGATLGRNIQYIQFEAGGENYTIINFHGLWNREGKGDSADRIEQSQKIRAFVETKAIGKVILVGDFNLDPDTKSMAILEKNMRNLITENNITSTRSHLHKWPNKFADYAIVSKDLEVKNFEALQNVASDHLPLLLEFN